jgi:hypothetical protein
LELPYLFTEGGLGMRTGWQLLNKLHEKFMSAAVVLLSFIMVFVPVGSAWGQEIGKLVQQKVRAENFVRLLKAEYTKKKISEQSFKKGEALYNDAMVDFNSYVAQVQSDIRAGKQPSQHNLKEAVEKSEKFSAYTEDQVYGTSRGGVAAAVVLIPPIANAVITFWKEYNKEKQQERDKLAQEFEQYKWQPFDYIK